MPNDFAVMALHGFACREDEQDWKDLILARRAKREQLPSAEETWSVARRIMNRYAWMLARLREFAGIA